MRSGNSEKPSREIPAKNDISQTLSIAAFQDSVRRQVRYALGKEWRNLSGYDLFTAVALAVRELLVLTGNPWNSPARMLADPMPASSWLALTSKPRRAAKLVEVAMVSPMATNEMPAAAA